MRGTGSKEAIRAHLERNGLEVSDFGTFSDEAVDYPTSRQSSRRRLRAAGRSRDSPVWHRHRDVDRGEQGPRHPRRHGRRCRDRPDGREHNDANILTLGGRVTSADRALAAVDAFLATPFAGGRHKRRVDKISAIERK